LRDGSLRKKQDFGPGGEISVRSWFYKLVARVTSGMPALLTLVLLAVLAIWGHTHDWKLPGAATRSEEPQKGKADEGVKVAEEPADPQGTPSASFKAKRIEFPSAEIVTKTGLHWTPVQVRPITQYVIANAMVDYEPSGYASLSARASGSIWRVAEKEIGDPVKKGEVLALIDASDVGRAKANFSQSLTQVRLKTRILDQLLYLYQLGGTPERNYLQAQADLQEAKTRLFNDQQALLNLGLPLRMADVEPLSDEKLMRYLRLLGLPEETRKKLDTETRTANLLPLTAPFDGQVVQRNIAPGEVVQAGQHKALFVVANVSYVHIHMNVQPTDMGRLRLGQRLMFRPDAGGEEVETAVTHISPEIDEKTRRVGVHAHTDNRKLGLRPNTYGTARILVGENPKAIVVPAESVQSDGDTHFVFIRLTDKSFQARQVQIGLREKNLIEVSGVRPGEEVVTAGSFVLKSELLKDRIAGED
jgi:membrane fusion protein, heavy metal efflux system